MAFSKTLYRNQNTGGALRGSYPLGNATGERVAHVFIESGQSNCQGVAVRADAPAGSDPGPIAGVKTWRRNQDGTMYSGAGAWYDLDYEYNQYEGRNEFGSILKFALDISEAIYDANNPIYMIKADGNGKPIAGWLNNGAESVAMYDGHITPALADLVADPTIDVILIHGFFWDQGESDAQNEGTSLVYESKLIELIDDLRSTLSMPTLPIIVRRMYTDASLTYAENVRVAQQNVADADSNVYLIDGPYTYDDAQLHLDGPAQNSVGAQRASIIQSATGGIIYHG